MEDNGKLVVDQFTPETVDELRAAFKAGGEAGVREVLARVRPGMAEEEILAVISGLEEEAANAAQAAAAPAAPTTEPKPAEQPAEGFDPFFGGPDPFRVTQEMAPVREPEPAPKPTTEPTTPVAADDDEDEDEPEEIQPEDVEVEPDPPPHPEDGRGKKVVVQLVVIGVLVALIVILLAVRSCGGKEEPAAPAPEPTPTETVLTIDVEQAIAACEARFQGYLTHDECVKAVKR